MGKLDYDDKGDEWIIDGSEDAPILGGSKNKHRLPSKRCITIGSVALLIIAVSSLIIYFQYYNEKPDVQFPRPPSMIKPALYSKAAVVSQGGPCPQIGVNVMAKGGNAVDAIIATMLCEGVQGPQNMGLGGGFIMNIYNATTKNVTTVNARVVAPSAATRNMFANKPPETSLYGGMAVAVPGELKGYATIYKLYGGGVSWQSLFEPTIQLCEYGMEINRHLHISLKARETTLIQNDPMIRKIFFDDSTGHVKKAGELYKFPVLAKTLKVIAKEGANALYNGSLTSQFIKDLKKVNGIITEDDLANYEVDITSALPIKFKNGKTIYGARPPGSGIILAYILRLLEGMLPAPDAALTAHRFVEAFKYGFAERSHLADYRFMNVSEIIRKVNSDSYMDSIRNQISDNFTSLDPKHYGADFSMAEDHGTANTVVVDSMGNAVVATSTINTIFGSGFMSPSTGIILNSEMDSFSAPGHVSFYKFLSSPSNLIQPGKRPMSSMCPTIITDENGDFYFGVGAAGGSKIPQTTAYAIALKLFCNKTLKEALDEPRLYHQLEPMEINYEYGTTQEVVQRLKDIGHPVQRLRFPGVSSVTAVAKTPSGMIEAMPDWKRLGFTAGY